MSLSFFPRFFSFLLLLTQDDDTVLGGIQSILWYVSLLHFRSKPKKLTKLTIYATQTLLLDPLRSSQPPNNQSSALLLFPTQTLIPAQEISTFVFSHLTRLTPLSTLSGPYSVLPYPYELYSKGIMEIGLRIRTDSRQMREGKSVKELDLFCTRMRRRRVEP